MSMRQNVIFHFYNLYLSSTLRHNRDLNNDKSMSEDELNIIPYTNPVVRSLRNTISAFLYSKGIDWEWVDEFKNKKL